MPSTLTMLEVKRAMERFITELLLNENAMPIDHYVSLQDGEVNTDVTPHTFSNTFVILPLSTESDDDT